jgi:MFS transporter, SET family, sugar efflux transporter
VEIRFPSGLDHRQDWAVTVPIETTAPVRVKSLAPLAVVSVLIGISTALWLPFMSLFLTSEVGANPFALGAFLFVSPVAGLVASTLIGRLSDSRAVRRNILGFGGVAGAVGFLVFAFVREYWVLLVISSTLGAVASSLMPQMFAYARQSMERSGSSRAPLLISSLRTLISVAWVAGPPAAALLVSVGGFGGLFAATAFFYAVVAVMTFRMPELGGEQPVVAKEERPRKGVSAQILFAVPAFVLAQGAVSLSVSAMPLFVTADLHGGPGDAGLILGLCAALEIPLMMWFGVLAVRIDHFRLVCGGMAVALAYHAVVIATSSAWQVAAAQVLQAIVISAVMGVGITFFQSLEPDRPGYATTLFTNTATAGAMLSGPLLGLAQELGYRTAYLMSFTMALLGLLLLVLSNRRK